MKSIHNHIKTLYDQGTPLFTRCELQSLIAQLDNLQDKGFKERKIHLTGMNKVVVDIPIETGKVALENETSTTGCEIISTVQYKHLRSGKIFHVSILKQRIFQSKSTTTFAIDKSQEWEASEQNRYLQDTLLSVPSFVIINKVIGFACGSLTFGTEIHRRSAIQHALLSSLRNYLFKIKESVQIQCYTQDPEYSFNEKQALKAIGIIALDDPKAFLEVDDASIVISIGPDIPVKQIITDIARPAAIIWCKQREEIYYMADPMSPRVQGMLSTEYIELDFPYHESIGDVALYFRKG
ncbi:hypothetical protein BKA67DRAFT_533826 [Truncatella angustata]|uniref:SRR1-like domain-containing protein n=1 Tax=Truncatella angustata TaxID=152316 RepID=A0A9P8UT91_9PEZI|nr:uncharacterized protein BKA67DRAFT_533826 [Truncatella angustata]KAH6658705.1 hypothetical protein BKA67DRAFT_533826 [Truncatella angustata]